jgi:HlyD family secretion protein
VDIAYSRAVLEQAELNKSKSFLYSPIDGVVSKVNKKAGELITPAEAVIEMISPHEEVVVDVSETDVVKLSIGDPAIVTFDALGSDLKFNGEILTIEPSSTDIQGVVYYKVKVGLKDENERIKTGMTADILVETEKKDGAIYLPTRAVITKDSKKYVKVLEGGTNVVEKEVVLGFKGDGGVVEIVSGLGEGEEVILKTLDK